MNVQRVKKVPWLRRRFVKGPTLKDLSSWIDEADALKSRIRTDSTYQLVGDKVILSVDSLSGKATVLIEVLGIPQFNMPYFDKEPVDSLQCEVPETVFDLNFRTLMERAQTLRSKIGHTLESEYHIVLEGRNLELHFFLQKDYIQAGT